MKYAKSKRVLLCDSLPSVEYWFLLHYENTNRHFGTSHAVIQELRQFMPDYDKSEQFLGNRKWVAEMSGEGKLDTACDRAEKFGADGQSYSKVYKIFRMLKK